jgi:antitoxin component of RelBE/YafQ-DinJ toxin-antitoxin module
LILAAKHDWPYLKVVWDQFKEQNPGATLKQFTIDNGLPYDSCQVAFKRINKRTDKPTTDKPTKNRQTLFDPVSPSEAKEVVEAVTNERVAAVHAEVLTRLYRALKRLEEIQDKESKVEIETPQDVKHSVSAVGDMVRTLREIMPFILELRDRGNLDDIITRLQNREYDVAHASLEISKMGLNLPEAMRILLAKSPPLVINQEFVGVDEQELNDKALEALEGIGWQYENFLPQRRQEVIELKRELEHADSFRTAEKPGNKQHGESDS